MTTAVRKQITINTEVMDLLNKQVKMEMHASATYLAMASWADQRGFTNAKSFFYEHAEEERGHAMKIFTFINNNGGSAVSPTTESIKTEYDSLRDLYEVSLEQEVEVTKSIFSIFKASRDKGDYISEIFMQWFVSEQSEEEATFRDILDIFELTEGMSLKMIDQHLPSK